MADEPAIPDQDGVDGTQASGVVGHFIKVLQHQLLARVRDVEAVEAHAACGCEEIPDGGCGQREVQKVDGAVQQAKALHIGLALHELAVNSVSFGALSRPDGAVTVAAELVAGPPGGTALSLTWREALVSADTPWPDEEAREKHFGSVALERVVPASLDGVARLEITPLSVEYDLVVPFDSSLQEED